MSHVEQVPEEPSLARFVERLGSLALAANVEPGEILVSSTVKDLTAGAGVSFAARGVSRARRSR